MNVIKIKQPFFAVISLCLSAWANADTYIYDNLNRITGVVFVNGSRQNYSYDAAGNLLSVDSNTINYSDTAFNDSFTRAGGSLANGNSSSYGITGGKDNGITISQNSAYGVLTVTKATGIYTFVPNDAAIEALKVAASVPFTVTSSNGSQTNSKTLTVKISQNGITESMGNDKLIGTPGNDTFDSLAGNDIINGLAGADTMKGGLGNDTYYIDNKGDIVTETSTLATEIDRVNSSITYTLGANLETLVLSGAAAINGTGNLKNNVLSGNVSANILSGGAGNDIIKGGAGADTLKGEVGKDTLTGGLDADKFVFGTIAESGITASNSDTITDFNHGQGDKINLAAIDANTTAAGNNAFSAPTVGSTFTGAFTKPGQLYFDKTAHILYGNNDADKTADFSIRLPGVNTLVAADFVL